MYIRAYMYLSAGLFLAAGSLHSQQKKDSIHSIKEVTITGLSPDDQLKRNQSQSTQILRQKDLQKHLGGSLSQTLERLPGINAFSIGSGQSKPVIRGLGFNRIVVTEHGVKHESQQWGADHGLEIDQYAAGTVKVIKGPAALMTGSDAIAGLIAIEPANIPRRDSASAEAILTAKSVNDLLGGSFAAMQKKNNLYLNSRVTYLDDGDYKIPADYVDIYSYQAPLHKRRMRNTAGQEFNVHLSGGYVSDRFRSIFYLSNLHSKSGLFANAHGLEPRKVDTDLYDASSRDIDFPSQQVNHFKLINETVLGYGRKNSLKITTGFQRNYREEFSNYIAHGYMPPLYPAQLQIPQELERIFDKYVYSAQAHNELSLGRHTLSTGISTEMQDNGIGGWSFLTPAYDQHSAGVYVHDLFKINSKLSLNAGARLDYGRISIREYYDWFAGPAPGGSTYAQRAQPLTRTFRPFTWGAGANYHHRHWQFRLNLGKSFRMPLAKELASNGVNYHYYSYEKGNAGLKAEESYQADFGAEFKKGKIHIDFNPFFQYFPNYIYLNPTSGFDFLYGAGNQIYEYTQSKVQRYGAELKAGIHFSDTFRTEILGEYVYSEQLSGSKKGYNLPFAPAPSALIGFTYEPKFSRTLSDSYLGVDFKIGAMQNRIVPPERVTDGYQILNLNAGTDVMVDGKKVNFYFQIQNLLNTKYFTHTNFYRLIGVPEAGRNFVLTLKVPI